MPGTTVYAITAAPVLNYTTIAEIANPQSDYNATISFCNVTISYGHQGWHDNVTVTVWLPLHGWTGRLSGIGGAGFSSLYSFTRFAPAVDMGWAAVATDAGHDHLPLTADTWALDPAGRVNYFLLENFFASSQEEAARIGKKVCQDLYGMLLAQRYPDAYDGILAGAPAINWATFVPGMYYPQFVMNQAGYYPPTCVWDAMNNATIEACDLLDGVKDHILSLPAECDFDPYTMVGTSISCDEGTVTINADDADMMVKFWEGPRYPDGSSIWYGMNKGTSPFDLANTTCSDLNCTGGYPFTIASEWISLFVLQNTTYDLTTLGADDFAAVMNLSISAHKALTSTDSPDLFNFRATGGKILHWHGLADQQIYPTGSEQYYKKVEARDPAVRDFYRFFEAPGVNHCGTSAPSGYGLFPENLMNALVKWVEEGTAPDVLPASTLDGSQHRDLCPWPQVPAYQGGDTAAAASYECADSY
ncbi:hypothetical protein LTR10_024130 [Elasticomyces elasticus]|uniref:Carboxylic ester hydrolase n=1 Tax=Exophiala sideris TaxID=1016849 RepID=A0ABR0JKV8_9EURO|nr:hypothetical protein LTR10_024130 [Elasticomyces elasticus]KAK5032230.1 hypothetical protein LTR13_007447 [Exophiala sideris]KAK5036228.1 hypothetical protein LTS07_001953 [Exophiala sideris]KAK5066611.1 hypothetical protein LTR69_001957 [Exophiala sideris]KAK5180433.1 hypothetical protein LTR44_007190 [Eurotiomycetes sp. CCFEE 6388]